jgi:hypothetical protein
MHIFTRSFVLVTAMLSSAAAQTPCSMCSDADATLQNPDFIIPYLVVEGEQDPTCRELSEFAPSILNNATTCALIQAQASFCDCPESTGPVNDCR